MLINSLGLKNFKCFEELDVKFAPITLLTGANSSGKSSLINAILGVLQTEDFPFYLSPNGDYVNMGSFEEMVFTKDTNKKVEIKIEPSRDSYSSLVPNFEWIWKHDESNNLPKLSGLHSKFEIDYLVGNYWELSIKDLTGHYQFHLDIYAPDVRFDKLVIDRIKKVESLKEYILPEDDINKYISIRIRKNFQKISEIYDLYKELNFIYRDVFISEFSIDDKTFNYVGSFRQPPERTYYQKAKAQSKIDSDGSGYIDQIIEWEENDSSKIIYLVEVLQKLELLSDLQSNNLKGGRFELNVKTSSTANWSSLTDVGFGISQFLPVIVADLQLPEKSCLAVSQPEIHLHPKIQASFGNYLAGQVKRGVKQYIIETHSEYLLNRIRLLLVTGDLKPHHVKVLYFENNGIKSEVHEVKFAIDGSVDAPPGFFDTYGIDVMNIAMEAVK